MTDQPTPPPASVRPRALSPTVMVLLIGIGIILLLPGLCSLAAIVILSGIDPRGIFNDGRLVLLWAGCIAVSIGGIMLIRYALRREPA
jgi:hypothetical protein